MSVERELMWSRTRPDVVETRSGGDAFRIAGDCGGSFPPWVNETCHVNYTVRAAPEIDADIDLTTGPQAATVDARATTAAAGTHEVGVVQDPAATRTIAVTGAATDVVVRYTP